jgi:hypothetical protein
MAKLIGDTSPQAFRHFEISVPIDRFEAVKDPTIPEFYPPKDLKELYFDEESWATPLPSYLEEES